MTGKFPMVIPSKSIGSSVLSAALHEKAEREKATKSVHKDKFLVFIITIWLFRLTKLQKAAQTKVGNAQKVVDEGAFFYPGKMGRVKLVPTSSRRT